MAKATSAVDDFLNGLARVAVAAAGAYVAYSVGEGVKHKFAQMPDPQQRVNKDAFLKSVDDITRVAAKEWSARCFAPETAALPPNRRRRRGRRKG